MPIGFGDTHQARMEHRQEDGGREAPVTEAHHPGAHTDGHSVPVAHVPLGRLVIRALRDQVTHCDAVLDERHVEDEQPKGRQPEGRLGEARARERAPDDSRKHVPAEAGGDQRASPHDHDVGVREVADEVARVPATSEPLGRPRDVLRRHVHSADDEEDPTRHEVLPEAHVLRPELCVRVWLCPYRRALAGQETHERHDDHREECDVAQELERREVLDPHDAGSAQPGLEEVDRQRPGEVEDDEHGEDHPGSILGPAGMPDLLPHIPVPDQRPGRLGLFHQKIFSMTMVSSESSSATSPSMRMNV